MAVSEQDRHNLRTDLVDAIGETSTNTLMNSLPVIDWSQIATKQDLDRFASKDDLQTLLIKILEGQVTLVREISDTGTSFERELRKMTTKISITTISMIGVVSGIIGFLR